MDTILINIYCKIGLSDWISIVSIIINSLLAVWIVTNIQKNQINKRVLKDFIIKEFIDIRSQYKDKIENLYNSKIHPKPLLPWFKLMNIKVINLMNIANTKYKIDKDLLHPFQIDLRDMITENESFIKAYSGNSEIKLTDSERSRIVQFLQDNSHVFNDLIVKINDA